MGLDSSVLTLRCCHTRTRVRDFILVAEEQVSGADVGWANWEVSSISHWNAMEVVADVYYYCFMEIKPRVWGWLLCTLRDR